MQIEWMESNKQVYLTVLTLRMTVECLGTCHALSTPLKIRSAGKADATPGKL